MRMPEHQRRAEGRAAVLLLCATVLWGCNREKSTSNTGAPDPRAGATAAAAHLKPVNPDDPPQAQEQARLAAVMAMRQGAPPPPPPALRLRGGELATPEVLAAYNQELLRVRIQQRESPESLEELVQKWIRQWRLLPPLPTPPPGKRIVYDDINCILRLDPP